MESIPSDDEDIQHLKPVEDDEASVSIDEDVDEDDDMETTHFDVDSSDDDVAAKDDAKQAQTAQSSGSAVTIKDISDAVLKALIPLLDAGFRDIGNLMVNIDSMVGQYTTAMASYASRFGTMIDEDKEAHMRYAEAFRQLKKEAFTLENQRLFLSMLAAMKADLLEIQQRLAQFDRQVGIQQDESTLATKLEILEKENAALKAECQSLRAHSIQPEEKSAMFSAIIELKQSNDQLRKANEANANIFNKFRESVAIKNYATDLHFRNLEGMMKKLISHFVFDAEPLQTQPPVPPQSSPFDADKKGEKKDKDKDSASKGERPKKRHYSEGEHESSKRKPHQDDDDSDDAGEGGVGRKSKYVRSFLKKVEEKKRKREEEESARRSSTKKKRKVFVDDDDQDVPVAEPIHVISSSTDDDKPISFMIKKKDSAEEVVVEKKAAEPTPTTVFDKPGPSTSGVVQMPSAEPAIPEVVPPVVKDKGKQVLVEEEVSKKKKMSTPSEIAIPANLSDEDQKLFKEAVYLGIPLEELKEKKQAELLKFQMDVRANVRLEDQEDTIAAFKADMTLEEYRFLKEEQRKMNVPVDPIASEAEVLNISVEEFLAAKVLAEEIEKKKRDELKSVAAAKKWAKKDVLTALKKKPDLEGLSKSLSPTAYQELVQSQIDLELKSAKDKRAPSTAAAFLVRIGLLDDFLEVFQDTKPRIR